MDYIVRYHTAGGAEKVEDVGSLDAAISRVEALRNDEGVSAPRLYREVKVEFRTYVRAQVVDEGAPAPDAPAPSPAASAAPVGSEGPADATASSDRPTATAASEPPPGSMPLSPQRPTTKINEAASIDDQPSDADEGGEDGSGDEGEAPRRTLFSRG